MPGKNRGFTLVELIVSLVIFVMIFAGMAAYMLSTQRSFFRGETKTEVVYKSTTALDLMVNELRQAGYHFWDWDKDSFDADPATPGNQPLQRFVIAAARQVRFQADLDDSNGIDAANEDITYQLNGATLERVDNIAVITDPLSDNVAFLAFSYFDQDNNKLTTPVNTVLLLNSIQRIEIDYATAELAKGVQQAGDESDTETIILNTAVTVRNESLAR